MNLKDRLSKGIWACSVRASQQICETLVLFMETDEYKTHGFTHIVIEQALAKIMDEVITDVLFPSTVQGKKLLEAYEKVMMSRQGQRAMRDNSNDRYFTRKGDE